MSQADFQARPELDGNRESIPDETVDHDEFLVFVEEDTGKPATGQVIRKFNLTRK